MYTAKDIRNLALLGHGGEGEEQERGDQYAEGSHGRIIRRF